MVGVGEGGNQSHNWGPLFARLNFLTLNPDQGQPPPSTRTVNLANGKHKRSMKGVKAEDRALQGGEGQQQENLPVGRRITRDSLHPPGTESPPQSGEPTPLLPRHESSPCRAPPASLTAGGQKAFCCEMCPKSI